MGLSILPRANSGWTSQNPCKWWEVGCGEHALFRTQDTCLFLATFDDLASHFDNRWHVPNIELSFASPFCQPCKSHHRLLLSRLLWAPWTRKKAASSTRIQHLKKEWIKEIIHGGNLEHIGSWCLQNRSCCTHRWPGRKHSNWCRVGSGSQAGEDGGDEITPY